MRGLIEIPSERPPGFGEKRRTWWYGGFVLNNWGRFFCFRPVEGELPAGLSEWVFAQPDFEGCGNSYHKLKNGKVASCLLCVGDLDFCCRLLDRWWQAQEEQGGKLIGWKAA